MIVKITIKEENNVKQQLCNLSMWTPQATPFCLNGARWHGLGRRKTKKNMYVCHAPLCREVSSVSGWHLYLRSSHLKAADCIIDTRRIRIFSTACFQFFRCNKQKQILGNVCFWCACLYSCYSCIEYVSFFIGTQNLLNAPSQVFGE